MFKGFHLGSGDNALTSKFGSFGVANTSSYIKPGKIRGLLVGPSGCGKTTLLSGNPAMLIANLDTSSLPKARTDAKPPAAQFFPFMDEEGRPCGPDLKPIKLDYDSLLHLEESLIEASIKNQPRPETVSYDSLTSWLNILRTATLKHFNRDEWSEGRGDAMWEWLYQRMNNTMENYRNAGYGFWLTAHVSPTMAVEGDGKNNKVIGWSFNAPPGFFKRFYGTFEMAIELSRFTSSTTENKKVPVVMSNGSTVMIDKLVTSEKTEFILTGDDPIKKDIVKRRFPFPKTLMLPDEGGWQVFESEYLKYANPTGSSK